jgi:hypothetical protein
MVLSIDDDGCLVEKGLRVTVGLYQPPPDGAFRVAMLLTLKPAS